MVFFMETKLDAKRMEKVQRIYGFNSGIEVGANESRGGLCLSWKDDVVVQLQSYSKSHIDVFVKEIDEDNIW